MRAAVLVTLVLLAACSSPAPPPAAEAHQAATSQVVAGPALSVDQVKTAVSARLHSTAPWVTAGDRSTLKQQFLEYTVVGAGGAFTELVLTPTFSKEWGGEKAIAYKTALVALDVLAPEAAAADRGEAALAFRDALLSGEATRPRALGKALFAVEGGRMVARLAP